MPSSKSKTYENREYKHTQNFYHQIGKIIDGQAPAARWIPRSVLVKKPRGKERMFVRAKEGKAQFILHDRANPFGYFTKFITGRVSKYLPEAETSVRFDKGAKLDLPEYADEQFQIVEITK